MSNFVKIGDDFLAEPWNGLMMLNGVLNPKIKINLPSDFNTGIYPTDGSEQKIGPFLVNLLLTDTEITTDGLIIRLQAGKTTGTATFRIYPNFEPLKQWLTLTTVYNVDLGQGDLNCEIYSNGVDKGSVAINPNVDISGKNLGLNYVDFVYTFTKGSSTDITQSPVLNSIALAIQGGD